MGALLSMEPLVHAAAFGPHLHLVVVACVLLTVAAIFWWGIHTLSFLFGRGQADRELLCSTGPSGAGTVGSAAGPQGRDFVMLFLAMGAALHADALVAAAAELRLHQAVVGIVVLAVAALFNSAIHSVHFLVARRSAKGESKTVFPAIASAASALTCHASRPQLPHFVVLCFAMGTALLAERLVAAAADLAIHSGVVTCFVFAATALFNWGMLSLYLHVARRTVEREHKMLPRPAAPAASAVRSPHPACLTLLVLAALMSASWFVKPFAAAAEHYLPKAAIAAVVLFFAALFNVSIHLFRSHVFIPCSPSSDAAAAQEQSVGTITAGIVSVGIAVAACLVGAVGSAYYVYSPTHA